MIADMVQQLPGALRPVRAAAVDAAKASVPIGGGVAVQYIHIADAFVTFLTHGVGAASAIVGFWWLLYRIRRDLSGPPKTKSKSSTELYP